MPANTVTKFHWLNDGDTAFRRMRTAIESARQSVLLETYTFKESALGTLFLEALVQACQRGVRVQVVIDFLGSSSLRTSFWDPLVEAGGAFRWFNPWNLWRLGIRNHRKILVCDESTAFVGGFNIAPEYEGNGLTKGWRDLGLEIHGPLARELAHCVLVSFARADFKHRRLQRLRRSQFNRIVCRENWSLLLSGPGRGQRHLKRILARDLATGQNIQIMAAYFLPTWRIRRELLRAARRGAQVQLILPSKSDVTLSLLATRCLYRRMLTAGIEIYEYLPQILHAKLLLIDNRIYAGSANLDPRSLNINYELLVRIQDEDLVREAREVFEQDRKHCRRIDVSHWKKERPWWRRWTERWAYYLLSKLDPYLSRLHSRDIP